MTNKQLPKSHLIHNSLHIIILQFKNKSGVSYEHSHCKAS